MPILSLIGGLVLLIISGKYLVLGSVEISKRLKISSMIVGLTVVAFGTSAPELLVSMNAAISGHPDIAVGNVIGSNIANIALVLALTALVLPIVVKSKTLLRDWLVMFLLAALFVLFTWNNVLSRLESGILLGSLITYIIYSLRVARKACIVDDIEKPKLSVSIALLIIVVTCAGLSYGADLLVAGASEIARNFGVDERTISISLVAFGTSVPELTTSLVAAFKKEMDISIGNIIGSNIFNIGAVLGITGLIHPIHIPNFFEKYALDMFSMLIVSILLLFLLLPLKNGVLTRLKGSYLFAFYAAYMYLLIEGITLF